MIGHTSIVDAPLVGVLWVTLAAVVVSGERLPAVTVYLVLILAAGLFAANHVLAPPTQGAHRNSHASRSRRFLLATSNYSQ